MDVKAQVDCTGDLVDILAAGALGPDRSQSNLIERDYNIIGDWKYHVGSRKKEGPLKDNIYPAMIKSVIVYVYNSLPNISVWLINVLSQV